MKKKIILTLIMLSFSSLTFVVDKFQKRYCEDAHYISLLSYNFGHVIGTAKKQARNNKEREAKRFHLEPSDICHSQKHLKLLDYEISTYFQWIEGQQKKCLIAKDPREIHKTLTFELLLKKDSTSSNWESAFREVLDRSCFIMKQQDGYCRQTAPRPDILEYKKILLENNSQKRCYTLIDTINDYLKQVY